jgi:saccharopine dehydrogenase-like NADP-dependent oxidoreductase
MTYAGLVEAFLPDLPSGSTLRSSVAALCNLDADGPEMDLVEWTGILSSRPIGLPSATPAGILQQLLEEKWRLRPDDKDMIVMQHRFGYTIGQRRLLRTSSLVVVGDDSIHTAMAKTVGLPAAIAARKILDGTVTTPGVCIPVSPEICVPVLSELESLGIRFSEKTVEVA